jgi:hypothetical protein
MLIPVVPVVPTIPVVAAAIVFLLGVLHAPQGLCFLWIGTAGVPQRVVPPEPS